MSSSNGNASLGIVLSQVPLLFVEEDGALFALSKNVENVEDLVLHQ
jgi:hypothetical protein